MKVCRSKLSSDRKDRHAKQLLELHADAAGLSSGCKYEVVQKGNSTSSRHTQPYANQSPEWRQSTSHLGCIISPARAWVLEEAQSIPSFLGARMSKLAMRRHSDRRLLLVGTAVAACAFWRSCGAASFSLPGEAPRRALLMAVPILGAPGVASALPAGITDTVEYMNRRKRELIPYMKQGIDYLEGHDIDERMMKFLPKMCKKMEAYAGLQSRDEAPDKTVYKLNADVRAFEKAVKNNDKPAALEAFQKYQNDMPQGMARFDIHNPITYEGPSPETGARKTM
ncbi:unnamed protein product [Symbiodinium microadriaticum]|nr:unnamed protein product [Symbiodinium sp. KB8]CAE7839688.1 unnamed protein product [Symbiodinium microadriaticum]